MHLQYIQLSNDHVILQTSKGPVSVTRESFNYVAIQRKLKAGCTEEDIAPLLATPTLVEGRYKVYINTEEDKLVYEHYNLNGIKHTKDLAGNDVNIADVNTYIGAYANMCSILEDWPEYAI